MLRKSEPTAPFMGCDVGTCTQISFLLHSESREHFLPLCTWRTGCGKRLPVYIRAKYSCDDKVPREAGF